MAITDYQAGLMHHTAGMISGEKRNWFACSAEGRDYEELSILVSRGFASVRNAPQWSGDDVVFSLTASGLMHAKDKLPEPEPVKKLTRSQQNYKNYLDADCGLTFADYMGWKGR